MPISEAEDILKRFTAELAKATADGAIKRQKKQKPPWYVDASHGAALHRHLQRWVDGEVCDKDSGAHPLVHVAWRALAIACKESGNIPGQKEMLHYETYQGERL